MPVPSNRSKPAPILLQSFASGIQAARLAVPVVRSRQKEVNPLLRPAGRGHLPGTIPGIQSQAGAGVGSPHSRGAGT
jgi:hypothetical protein